jgi:ubiquinone/menaquinone biosynthesis C-methylase UbiE
MGMEAFDPERKRLIYKEYAKTYDEDRRTGVGEEVLRERMEYVASHVQEGSKVLDLGCGTGDLLRILSQRVGHDGWCVGVDISPEMLEVAKTKLLGCKNVELQIGDVTKEFPFDSNYFDVVAALNINQEIPLKLQKYMFEEAHRILKKGGVFIGCAACLSGTTEAEKCYSDIAKEYLWYFYLYWEIDEIFQDIFGKAETAFKPNPKASLSESRGKLGFKLFTEIMNKVKGRGYNPDEVLQGVLSMRGIK